MNTPDITKAQVVALAQACIAVCVAFGFSLSAQQQSALLGVAAAIAVVLPLADAIIRHGRSSIMSASINSENPKK